MSPRVTSLLAVVFFLGVLGLVLWLGLPTAERTSPEGKLFVVTTIYPLQDFAENIGGEHVYVSNVIPAGAEPHDYEPSPRDVGQVLEADVLVYIGNGLDTWAADLADQVKAEGGQVVGADEVVTMKPEDPHVWLDPVLAQSLVEAMRDAFVAADPEHETDYAANAQAYLTKLQELDRSYQASLADCRLNDIIVSHDALGYLAERYDFVAHPISGLSPEAEPSVKDLTALARSARTLGVKTIFFETLVSPALAETLASEIGAETAVLDPLEGVSPENIAAGQNYLSIMDNNRLALAAAMLCQ